MDFRELCAWKREAAIQRRDSLLRLSEGVRLANASTSDYERVTNELKLETAIARGLVTREELGRESWATLRAVNPARKKKHKR